MSKEELVDHMLDDPHAAEWLRLADNYIQAYLKSPSQFILPREHVRLKSLIEDYANDLPGFVRYIRTVRDAFMRDTPSYASLHKLYRTISTRLLQQQRRIRLRWAVDKALELRGHPASPDTKGRYGRMLEQQWGKARLLYLEQYRSKTHGNRLAADEVDMVLEEFWKMIDGEIERGELPPMEGE